MKRSWSRRQRERANELMDAADSVHLVPLRLIDSLVGEFWSMQSLDDAVRDAASARLSNNRTILECWLAAGRRTSPLPETDFDELADKDAELHPAFSAFKKEMVGRCYGREALNDAWAWFQEGWVSRGLETLRSRTERMNHEKRH